MWFAVLVSLGFSVVVRRAPQAPPVVGELLGEAVVEDRATVALHRTAEDVLAEDRAQHGAGANLEASLADDRAQHGAGANLDASLAEAPAETEASNPDPGGPRGGLGQRVGKKEESRFVFYMKRYYILLLAPLAIGPVLVCYLRKTAREDEELHCGMVSWLV